MPDQPPYTWPPPYLPTPDDYNALVHFKRWGVQAATRVYVTVDDVLVLRVAAPSLSVTVNVSVRLQTPDGQIIPMFRSFAVSNNTSTITQFTLETVEGFILSANVDSPGTNRGFVFCSLEIIRGVGTSDQTTGYVLLAGYPSINQRLSFPQTPIASPLDGRGVIFLFSVTAPAAGADWSLSCLSGEQWLIKAVRARLVTSATVATRFPHLQIHDTVPLVFVDSVTTTGQAASLTVNYTWFPASSNTLADGSAAVPIPPDVRMTSSMTLGTVTTALQAADQWSNIVVNAERLVQG